MIKPGQKYNYTIKSDDAYTHIIIEKINKVRLLYSLYPKRKGTRQQIRLILDFQRYIDIGEIYLDIGKKHIIKSLLSK